MTVAEVARKNSVNKSSIRTIGQNKEKIRKSIESSVRESSKFVTYSRKGPIEKVENALALWIEDQTQKRVAVSSVIIRDKATKLHDNFLKNESSSSNSELKPFVASKRWFDKFKNWHSLHSLKLMGESASADHEAAKLYPDRLMRIIEDGCYLPQQVFNADETGLFWKKMPSRTFISKIQMNLEILLPNRYWFIIDNAPGHPANRLQSLNENVKIEFLPPNTTSLIQPLDQGIIAAFKAYYTRITFKKLLDRLESDLKLTLTQCWKNYNIGNCIDNIEESCRELKKSTLNGCWRKIWPTVVTSEKGNDNDVNLHTNDIQATVTLGRLLPGVGFSDLQLSDIEELLESHNSELTVEELGDLVTNNNQESSDSDDNKENTLPAELSLKTVNQCLKMGEELTDFLIENDLTPRSLKSQREILNALAPYKSLQQRLQNETKQSKITDFLSKK
ncbi:tigger transposable element-derived protein 1-like [Onthophagus taurus]|uniref:tigger transposable element-derived protein 1-like n=1 Tax=Onthophagus taurus TaxID=166361 RepID=UPI0039BDB876